METWSLIQTSQPMDYMYGKSKIPSHPKKHPAIILGVPSSCALSRKPPLKPTKPLCPTTKVNWQCLQQWLVDYYRSSTFNILKDQPLPLMEGVPMRRIVDPSVKPLPNHTQPHPSSPISVPVGKPVLWCHYMALCPKKNNKHCYSVFRHSTYMQLEKQTQGQFLQAWSIPSNKKKTWFYCWNGYHSISQITIASLYLLPHEIVSHIPNNTKSWGWGGGGATAL